MKIRANTLELRNINQLVSVNTKEGVTMGKIERVKFLKTGQVSIRVSGETVGLDGAEIIDIRRDLSLGAIIKMNRNMDDFFDDEEGYAA